MSNKVAIVTGGARGIGKAIVKSFVKEGIKVVIADINENKLRKTISELNKDDKKVFPIRTDITKTEDINTMVNYTVNKFGKLDILVNNAGIQIRCPSINFSEQDWDKLMDLNLKATFFCSQAAAKVMVKKGGGSIVNISSGTSINTTPGRAPYCISKAGVNGLTAVLGAEWAKHGIRVNAVAPGWILTDMVKDGIRLGVVSEKEILSITPIGRLASAQEIADAVLYLASEKASYTTGQTLFVDGGWSVLGLPQDID